MTPKEKAKALLEKYNFVIIPYYTSKFEAKECALIVVDEIIIELLECGEVWMKGRIKYWQEVKQEIENL